MLFLVPLVIQCYHENEFVRGYSRFSKVSEIVKVFKSKI